MPAIPLIVLTALLITATVFLGSNNSGQCCRSPKQPNCRYFCFCSRWFEAKGITMSLVLLIILVLLVLAVLPAWPYSSGWGYYPSGGLGVVLIIVLILVLSGRI